MIKLAAGLLVAGLAASPFIDRAAEPVEVILTSRDTHLSSMQNTSVYIVSSGSGIFCRMTGNTNKIDSISVVADAGCEKVHPGLERVTQWTHGAQGQDALLDASGKTILLIGPSDGFAYEAILENGAQISFALNEG